MPPTDPAALPPLLLPAPRSLTLLGGALDTATDPMGLVLQREDPTLAPQAYRLAIGQGAQGPEPTIFIIAKDAAGVANAWATLAQLFTQYGPRLPRLVIDDAPALYSRGLMLDVSRDRVPTNHTLRATATLAASLKLNHLQLYTEHTFAYAGHQDLWRGSSPITPAEIARLDHHCRAMGIDLAANQNCFGHLTRWLTHPRYAPLAETHADYDFYGLVRKGPFSLCPTDERSLELVTSWLDQLLPCFSSPFVNINCDETADVGQGRSRHAVAERGPFDVYMSYVRHIADACAARGKRPMFWADVALHHPERAADIPDHLVSMVWGYEPSSPFNRWCKTLADAGKEFWVCPGTGTWRTFTGRTRERAGNLAAAMAAATTHHAAGVLITEWGDLGHRQQHPLFEHALAHAAAVAWNPGAPADPRAISLHVFRDRSLRLATWLDELGNLDADLRAVSGRRPPAAPDAPAPLTNASALFEHLHPCGHRLHLPTDPRPWADLQARLLHLSRTRPTIASALVNDELDHALACADLAATHAVWERTTRDAATRDHLRARAADIAADHARLWLARSRTGGLEASLRYYAPDHLRLAT